GIKGGKGGGMGGGLAAVISVAAASLIGGAFLHQKQVLETKLRDQQRQAVQEKRATDLLLQGETAKFGGDLGRARELLGQALAKIDDQDALAELVSRIRDSLAEVDRQLAELAARQDALRRDQHFWALHNEAMFQGTMFTGGDLPTSLVASRRAALEALSLFGITGDPNSR